MVNLFDDFNVPTNNTATLISPTGTGGWTRTSNSTTYAVSGGALTINGTGSTFYFYRTNPTGTPAELSTVDSFCALKYVALPTNASAYIGPCVRWNGQTGATQIWYRVRVYGTGAVNLQRAVNSATPVSLTSVSATGVVKNGDVVQLEAEDVGATVVLRLFVNGSEVTSQRFTDSSASRITSSTLGGLGTAGINGQGASLQNASFDYAFLGDLDKVSRSGSQSATASASATQTAAVVPSYSGSSRALAGASATSAAVPVAIGNAAAVAGAAAVAAPVVFTSGTASAIANGTARQVAQVTQVRSGSAGAVAKATATQLGVGAYAGVARASAAASGAARIVRIRSGSANAVAATSATGVVGYLLAGSSSARSAASAVQVTVPRATGAARASVAATARQVGGQTAAGSATIRRGAVTVTPYKGNLAISAVYKGATLLYSLSGQVVTPPPAPQPVTFRYGPDGSHWPPETPYPSQAALVIDVDADDGVKGRGFENIRYAINGGSVRSGGVATTRTALTAAQVAAGVVIRVAPGRLQGSGAGSSSRSVFSQNTGNTPPVIGNRTWTRNVLIVPRDGYGSVTLFDGCRFARMERITFLGFDGGPDVVSGTQVGPRGGSVVLTECYRSWFAWSRVHNLNINNWSAYSGAVECIMGARDIEVGQGGATRTNDVAASRSAGPPDPELAALNVNFKDISYVGCHFGPSYKLEDPTNKYHVDTFQFSSSSTPAGGTGNLDGLYFTDTVLFGSTNQTVLMESKSQLSNIVFTRCGVISAQEGGERLYPRTGTSPINGRQIAPGLEQNGYMGRSDSQAFNNLGSYQPNVFSFFDTIITGFNPGSTGAVFKEARNLFTNYDIKATATAGAIRVDPTLSGLTLDSVRARITSLTAESTTAELAAVWNYRAL